MDAYNSQEIKELAKALIAVQRDMAPALKDSTNPFCRSKYASLNSVMESCRPALLKHGIWLCQYPVPVDNAGCIGLLTKLTHADSGQWQSSLTIVPLPKADPHGMGSAITYARRYALSAMLGIVTEDDDGEAAKIDTRHGYTQSKTALRTPAPTNMPLESQEVQESYFEETPGIPQEQALNRTSDLLARLPQLDGISYRIQQAEDGRDYIVASGNTMAQKGYLKNAGFRWDAQGKVWWMYANAA